MWTISKAAIFSWCTYCTKRNPGLGIFFLLTLLSLLVSSPTTSCQAVGPASQPHQTRCVCKTCHQTSVQLRYIQHRIQSRDAWAASGCTHFFPPRHESHTTDFLSCGVHVEIRGGRFVSSTERMSCVFTTRGQWSLSAGPVLSRSPGAGTVTVQRLVTWWQQNLMQSVGRIFTFSDLLL